MNGGLFNSVAYLLLPGFPLPVGFGSGFAGLCSAFFIVRWLFWQHQRAFLTAAAE